MSNPTPTEREVIEVGAEIIARHRTSLQPGPLDREIAETVIRAADEKRGLRTERRTYPLLSTVSDEERLVSDWWSVDE